MGMKKILIVDDSRTVRESLKFFLTEEGYEVIQGADGQDALNVIQDQNCDLVITDVNMPNMDGLTLIGELRKMKKFKFTPILVLTTESQQNIMEKGKALGATGWIVKPFDNEKVIGVIRKVLGD
ncbi:response regulator [Oceanispirochaeta crateris]|jgi:two-component system chemotaxis response regulator CheY|uniref:Response regulator n=2 Tax=Oceanispirochaeta crateris TaxID=2518645 RepID=A0A5C1QJG4_9SPIO|nr:response regulator [Oceanispirochaeta crateris]QEN07448.1 response regulator [Oceanispirochaeta crateris]